MIWRVEEVQSFLGRTHYVVIQDGGSLSIQSDGGRCAALHFSSSAEAEMVAHLLNESSIQ